MEILIGEKGNVDFGRPVRMNKKQKKEFLELLESMFSVVEKEHVDTARRQRIGDKVFQRKWTLDEYSVLLETENTSKVAERLGRTWMSVDLKRGSFLPSYMEWAEKKGIDLVKENTKELIQDYLEDKEFVKKVRKEKRKKLDELKEELEDMEEREENLDIDFLKSEGVLTEEELDKFEERKKNIKKEIESAEEVLANVKNPEDVNKVDKFEEDI